MPIHLALQRFKTYANRIAIIEGNRAWTYSDLLALIEQYRLQCRKQATSPRSILLQGDFSVAAIAYLMALLAENHVVTLSSNENPPISEWSNQLGLNAIINSLTGDFSTVQAEKSSGLIQQLIEHAKPGLVLLSSGSTGEPKWIVHDITRLMHKYQHSKKSYVTLGFLLFDHIAGFDTLMYTLHAGGSLVLIPNRLSGTVLHAMHQHQVEVLPTTPSFLNLLLFENDFDPKYLPHLAIITFGSERMNDTTLNRLQERFKEIRCEQKYGLTELGSLMLKSKPDDPRWVQLDARFVEWKVTDGVLFIKSESSLVGYIYAHHETPCSGWFNTGDMVEVDGEWMHILGRASEIINVGGQKVYPAEIETVLQTMDNVRHVVAKGEPHPLMGQVVSVLVQIDQDETEIAFRQRMRAFCKDKLASFKIPVFVSLQKESIITDRFKSKRVS
ncbi:MAG: long-chain fatty acid--CoA ligase [Chitinophagaceae bacterium]|nr:long-chain fatty acid--CoA ligase [Chitinophagaceae bacterium]